VVYIFMVQPITLSGSGTSALTTFDYSFLLASSLVVSSCLYASTVVEALTVGSLSKSVVAVLRLGCVPWGLAMLLFWSGFPAGARIPVLSLLGVSALVQLRIFMESVSVAYIERTFAVFDCAVLLVGGYLVGLLIMGLLASSPYSAHAAGLAQTATWAFTATGVSSLLGLYKAPEGLESWLSGKLPGGLPMRLAAFSLLFFYIFLLRGALSSSLSIPLSQLAIFEWLVVSLIAFAAFRSYKGYAREYLSSPSEELWGRHSQRVEWKADKRLSEVSEAITGFVDGGGGEELVTCMFKVMSEAGGDPSGMAQVVAPIVNHQDVDRGLMVFSWKVGYIGELNRSSRMRDVEDAVVRLEKYLHEAWRASRANGRKN